jgi:dethiobiotin synthetase
LNYLVTGSDTGVGKTYITSRLVRALRRQGRDSVAMKPWCSGSLEDVHILTAANNCDEPEHLINPTFFQAPVAPFAAAMIEGRVIDLGHAQTAFETLAKRHEDVLVEGAGGLLVPITQNFDYRELALAWRLEVIVVVANRLGAINHARLTIEALGKEKLSCRGILLNLLSSQPDDLAQQTNQSILELTTSVPVVRVEFGQTDLTEAIRRLRMMEENDGGMD